MGDLKAGSTDLRASPQKPPSNSLASLMLADPTFRDSTGLPGRRRAPARGRPSREANSEGLGYQTKRFSLLPGFMHLLIPCLDMRLQSEAVSDAPAC